MNLTALFKKILPQPQSVDARIYNLKGSSPALFLALQSFPFIAIEKDEARAKTLQRDINFYRAILSGEEVVFLPDPNGAESAGRRAEIIWSLKANQSVVASSQSLESRIWQSEGIEDHRIFLKKGLSIHRDALEDMLTAVGYKRAEMVVEKGEYSRREWIFDVFPSTSEDPVRVEFFGDEIEELRRFNVETQMSSGDLTDCVILPAEDPEEPGLLAETMPEKRFFCLYPEDDMRLLPHGAAFLSRYSFDMESPSDENLISHDTAPIKNIDAGMLSLKGLGILPDERKTLEELPGALGRLSKNNRVVIVASSAGQAERLRDIMREHDLIAPAVDVSGLEGFRGNISITVGNLSSGFCAEGLIVLAEQEIFGERLSHKSMVKSRISGLLSSLDDIRAGDFVVHREHGIGRFAGTVRREFGESEVELMLIEYEGGRLYIPVHNINSISKYHSEEGVVPGIDRLGGKTWQRKKERVRKKVREMAINLLSLYAGRKEARGFVFSTDTELHREFDSFFAYEETPDQLRSIDEIKRDMESEKPMDRLLCGDVGYGKTEVAMRAAFKAVYDSRQVAVLVPTTILAEQHFRTFSERFSGFPVSVDFLSRFKSKKQISETLKGIAQGAVDIVIGTHTLLSKKMVFNRLGLLIVDEEHRFGVGQKEKIKALAKNIDVLNLSATPIPRTLHMAISGIRDISVIETPPEERLSVKTAVTTFSEKIIRDSIEAELRRNGQTYFVHNRIHDIYKTADYIKKLAPSARIGVAHGQMPEKELESVMHRFFEGSTDVLVSTAIIGSGLDIPRANTIIVNRAEKMGLADLYQLRGRVGRSTLKAYAFFIAPVESSMTEEAKKRLQAVQEMSYLGAGFRLALKDLEIRGAGNIFGAEQSGHIHEIGFDLYIEMLEKAVAELKGTEIKEEIDPSIDLRVSALIPEEYIGDITLRLSFYRRIASLRREKEAEELQSELKDRFGTVPDSVISLLNVMRLKMLARELLISQIKEAEGRVKFIFSPDTTVEPKDIFRLRDGREEKIRFLPEGFEIVSKGLHGKEIFEEVYAVLQELVQMAVKNEAVSGS